VRYIFRDITLSEEEFFELKLCVGEFRRICRDQVYRYVNDEYLKSNDEVSNNRFKVLEALSLFLNKVESLNKAIE
jgi:hypothetical protein